MLATRKIVLTVAAVLVATVFTYAQSYSLAPNDTINKVGMMEDLESLSIQQLNTISDTIQLKWKKVSESVPALWDVAVCDNAFCYASLVDSGDMNPVLETEYGLLLLKITPHVNYGTAIIRYEVWDVTKPILRDTLTYILTVKNNLRISETESNNFFSINPNPSSDYINIISSTNENCSVIISNALGEIIYNSTLSIKNLQFSISDFPSGKYFVTLSNSANRITQTFVKN